MFLLQESNCLDELLRGWGFRIDGHSRMFFLVSQEVFGNVGYSRPWFVIVTHDLLQGPGRNVKNPLDSKVANMVDILRKFMVDLLDYSCAKKEPQ
jgi:hypothetical protein